jgi:phosphocarrier protein HPr
MYEKEVKINTEGGLHARPASNFVKAAASFKNTEIEVRNKDKRANAKSIMAVLSLGAGKGTTVIIRAEGEEEKDAVELLGSLIDRKEG